MTNFIVIFTERHYGSTGYSATEEHVELPDVRSVERFINSELRRNRWMKPTDFRVFSARRAEIICNGKPVEDLSRLSRN